MSEINSDENQEIGHINSPLAPGHKVEKLIFAEVAHGVQIEQWVSYFFGFFDSVETRFTSILDGSNFRELWLQGELFLYSKKDDNHGIESNSSDFKRKKIDLHGKFSNFQEMIAEIKIIGYQGYTCSDILGWGGAKLLKSFLQANTSVEKFSRTTQIPDKTAAHSLLKDYEKLKKINNKALGKSSVKYIGKKYLILIIPHRKSATAARGGGIDETMKNALHQIEFVEDKRKSWTKNYNENFTVRIWSV